MVFNNTSLSKGETHIMPKAAKKKAGSKTTRYLAINEADIDKVIQDNLDAFKKPGVLTVRPGYKIKNGWITNRPAIVVTVRKKRARLSAKDAIPARIGRFATDVREASTWQKIRRSDPQEFAALMTFQRPEFDQPAFGSERDAQTGQLLQTTMPSPEVAALAATPLVPYTPAPNAPLTPVTDNMTITFCASPDAGWTELKKFLQDIGTELTVGIYDFTSAHVLEAVEGGLNKKQKLSLVLDHPAPNPTADQSDEDTEDSLNGKLGNRQKFAWAAEARDPKVTSGIFPNAYHIKVAVKDHKSFWLSSGNWNNSNQPDIDPFAAGANQTQIDKIAKKSDRDWHAIVWHEGLAKTFEAYLKHDLKVATPLQAGPAMMNAMAAAMPESALAPSPEAPLANTTVPAKYFKPFQITAATVKIQPVLTPDAGAGNYVQNFLALIKSATKKLYVQTQYLHPPNSGTYPGLTSIIEALKDRISKGVDVRLIFSQFEATGGWLEKLQQAGIDASKFVKIQSGVHNKGFVVDSKVVALGSQNWSGDGVERNRDASLIVFHEGAAKYFEEIFLHDWTTLAKTKLAHEASTTKPASTKKGAKKGASKKK
jgi:hypothetical protein